MKHPGYNILLLFLTFCAPLVYVMRWWTYLTIGYMADLIELISIDFKLFGATCPIAYK